MSTDAIEAVITKSSEPAALVDAAMVELTALEESHAYLANELRHLVRLLESLERDGGLNVPGLATLNGARAALKKAGAL